MFIILTDLTSFLLSFVCWSFQVLGVITMNEGLRSGKSLRLGMTKAPQGNILGRLKHLSLGMPRKASPLLSQSIGMSLEAVFYSSHDMSFAWSVICFSLLFCFSFPQSLFAAHTHLRETQYHHNLLEYSMCFTYIFWAWQLL